MRSWHKSTNSCNDKGRVSYRALRPRFQLDDETLAALKDELIYAERVARDEEDRVLVWIGEASTTSEPAGRFSSYYRDIRMREDSRSISWSFACTSLRALRSARTSCTGSDLQCTGRNQPSRISWAIPRASFLSVLTGMALKASRTRRVSNSSTASPASASAA
jgi:hypothetical protein